MKRKEWWDQPKSGDKQVWFILQESANNVADHAKMLLEAVELELPDGSMHTVKDKNGTEYKVPYYCINDDINAEIAKEKTELAVEPSNEKFMTLKIKCGADTTTLDEVGDKTTVKDLKKAFKKESGSSGKVRLIYMGKEMEDHLGLYAYNLNENMVILAMVK